MKINLHIPESLAFGAQPTWIIPAVATIAVLGGLVLLPGPALFMAGLAGAIGFGITIAELRRHGEPGLPSLPFGRER